MANTNSPYGLRYIRSLVPGNAPGAMVTYIIPASDSNAYFVGDPIKSTGTGGTGPAQLGADTFPSVILSAAGNTSLGVIMAIGYNPNNLNIQYGAPSTLRYAQVMVDPFAVYSIQLNGVGAVTDFGGNADLAAGGGGSTITGISSYVLDISTITASSAQMRILGKILVPGNETGLYENYAVMFNEHEYKSTTGVHS